MNDSIFGKTLTLNNSATKAVTLTSFSGYYVTYVLSGVPGGTTISVTATSTPKLVVLALDGSSAQYGRRFIYHWIPSIHSAYLYYSSSYQNSTAYSPSSTFNMPNYAPNASNSSKGNLFTRYNSPNTIGNAIYDCTDTQYQNYPILSISGNTVTATFQCGVDMSQLSQSQQYLYNNVVLAIYT